LICYEDAADRLFSVDSTDWQSAGRGP